MMEDAPLRPGIIIIATIIIITIIITNTIIIAIITIIIIRRDMMDDALLRPGRLEVQIEIGLPKEKGRTQILHIHTKKVTYTPIITIIFDQMDVA